MAKITLEYPSEALAKNITLTAIIPQSLTEKKIYPCLYLLHGLNGQHSDWCNNTRVQMWANEREIAVIMPSADNKFYVDIANTHEYYSRFIGEELVQVTRNLFPLSTKREETYIGGLSMGGYGAFTNGLKYHKTFGAIIAFSSAFIIDEIPQVSGDIHSPLLENKVFYTSIFGPLDQLIGSDKDYRTYLNTIPTHELPRLYLSCGTEDFFIEQNRSLVKLLESKNINHTYIEILGEHNWKSWDTMILPALEWLKKI